MEDRLRTESNERPTREEMQKLTEMFKRMSNFEQEFEDEHAVNSDQDPVEKLAALDLDKMPQAELEAILGSDLMLRFQNYVLSRTVSQELEAWKPWWADGAEGGKVEDASAAMRLPPLPQGLPAFRQVSKTPPSEFLWTNLVEILFVYSYVSRTYIGDLESLQHEVVQTILDLSQVLSATVSKHDSVPEAIIQVLNAIKAHRVVSNPPEFSAVALKDVVTLLQRPEYVLRAVSALEALFCTSLDSSRLAFGASVDLSHLALGASPRLALGTSSDPSRPAFLASKKLHYYCVWFNSELEDNLDFIEEIFGSICLIIGGVHDKLIGKQSD